MTEKNARASKKQQELLAYINEFIQNTGYGPSYREVMRALDYKSVSTVATHVDGLISKGYLRKTDNSARSLEVVTVQHTGEQQSHQAWLLATLKQKSHNATPEQRQAFGVTLAALGVTSVLDEE